MVTMKVELTDEQAHAFAQFLKRAGLGDYKKLSVDENEAYQMLGASESLRTAFAEVNISPR